MEEKSVYEQVKARISWFAPCGNNLLSALTMTGGYSYMGVERIKNMFMAQKKNFQELIQGEKPVLVDFHATWCGPCQMMPPILDELKQKVGDKATILKIDVDKNAPLAAKYSVRGVPTLMLFQNGKVKWRQSGVQQAGQLQQVIEQYAS